MAKKMWSVLVALPLLTNAQNVGIGNPTPNAPLQFSQNFDQNRKIVMYEDANNDHQFNGFGINPGSMRYQIASTFSSHIFYAGTSDAGSAELMRIKGNGNIGIGTTAPNAPLQFSQNSQQNRKIVMFENVNNDHQYYGFGINPNVLRYQVFNSFASHVFYAGTSDSTSAEIMRIKGNGNVGIGNDNPNAPLQFSQNFEQNRKIVMYEDANNDHQFNGFGINTNSMRYQIAATGASHIFYAGTGVSTSAELMRIKGNGNVGIGNSNPNAPLQFSQNVDQNRKIVLLENVNNDHQYYGFGINNNIMRYQIATTGSSHVFYAGNGVSSSAELMRVKGNGNVGIGTATPNAPLQFSQIYEQNRKIVLYENANNDHQFNGFGINANSMRYQVAATGSSHVFYAGTGVSSSAELMRIQGNGNVGIGIATPNAPLQFAQIYEQNRKIVLYENANNDHQFNGFGLNTNILRYQVGNTLASHVFYAGTSVSSSAELMRIQGNGNVGIGTTTPNAPLQFSQNYNQNRKIVLYEEANNDHQYNGFGINPGIMRYQISNTNSSHVFYTGDTYANSIELMRINGNGTIGMGGSGYTNTKLAIYSNFQFGVYIEGFSPSNGEMMHVTGKSGGDVVQFDGTASNILNVSGTASNYNLYVAGSAAKTDGSPFWSVPSDARLKENITPYREGLAELLRINPVKYHYTKASGLNNNHENIGIVAQELKEVAPYMVFKKKGEQTDEEFDNVNLSPMLFMYVNAIKELDAKNKAQEIRISKLEALVQEMEARDRR